MRKPLIAVSRTLARETAIKSSGPVPDREDIFYGVKYSSYIRPQNFRDHALHQISVNPALPAVTTAVSRVRWLLVRAVVQRVSQASVTVDGQVIGAIDEPGLLVLVGVTHDDTKEKAAKLAAKLWGLRILHGEKSCEDLNAPLLVVSQFTLYAETNKGRRPTWINAAPGPVAEPLVNAVTESLRQLGAHVETGSFGADMKVALVNDGPVTIILDL